MQSTNSVSVRLMACVMALFPVAIAVLCHTGLRSEPLSITVPSKPALAFNQYAVDLRTVSPASVAPARFMFQNAGHQPVQITDIVPSCHCLTAKLYGARENVIEPNGQGQLFIEMHLENTTPGPHDYMITVKYTDPEPRETQLLLRLVVPAKLWVNPPSLFVFHPSNNTETTEKEFIVCDSRGNRFDITDVSANSELVEAVVGETSRSATGKFQQSVMVRVAPKLPSGRKTYVLSIKTTDPDAPELRVPLMLEGESRSESEPTLDHEQASSPAAK